MRRLLSVAVTLAALTAAGCARDPDTPALTSWDEPAVTSSPTTTPDPEPTLLAQGFGEAPPFSPTPEPETATAPEPAPTRAPVTPPGPPPPPPAPAPVPSDRECPWYDGEKHPLPEVRDALVTAANHQFWPDAPITVPVELIKAIAWQESGWQSTIMACDGGIGTMQVMPNTATWMNQRFGTSYDVHTLHGNTMIGAAYLQWLIRYFGDVWFDGSYDLNPAHCEDHRSPCLLNAVIASYNYGFGAVDLPDRIVIPNPQYVENVRALTTECVCLSY